MALKRWTRLSHEPFFEAPYYRFSHDRFRLPDGREGEYYYLDIPGSSMVVPRLPDGRILLVRQYRYLLDRESLELPAGGMRSETDPLENARKELREETGYIAGRWQKLGAFAPYNGACNELCHVYLAEELQREGAARPEATEEFELVRLRPAELAAAIASGEVWDGQTIVAFHYLQALGGGTLSGGGGPG